MTDRWFRRRLKVATAVAVVAVATAAMNIHLSSDDGETWRPVLVAGRSR